MPCPNCQHTLQSVGPLRFWCPRCGTIQMEDSNEMPSVIAVLTLLIQALDGNHETAAHHLKLLALDCIPKPSQGITLAQWEESLSDPAKYKPGDTAQFPLTPRKTNAPRNPHHRQ